MGKGSHRVGRIPVRRGDDCRTLARWFSIGRLESPSDLQARFFNSCRALSCPKNIPLTASISVVYGQTMRQAIGDFFQRPELTSPRKEPGRR